MNSKFEVDSENLIIDRPDLVPPGQKLTAWGITLLFWGALLYLWQPLLSIIAWGLNIHLFYNHMILLGGYRTFLDLLAMYLTIIALLGGGLILWARINQWRFRGRERRTGIDRTNIAALCKNYGVESAELETAMQHRVISVTFTETGLIEIKQQESLSNSLTEKGEGDGGY
ncbi:MAG TPA: poly-beta-1,6-N-acetyl-D-glucosamine biosynthesis protein PgaD [Spongiibacteraceae bacterium]|nr:poly-beta-1,6-N-acetyl-D-glucosamine biosynthesis protein PgaD [Spongiibacteraceae bacterium]